MSVQEAWVHSVAIICFTIIVCCVISAAFTRQNKTDSREGDDE